MTNLLVEICVRGIYNLFGLDSPYSANGYGPNWSKQRRKCLDRDSRTCRVCRTHEDELGRELSVHHITPRTEFDDGEWRQMNATSNLISLCPTCHGRNEGKHTDCSPEEFAAKALQE